MSGKGKCTGCAVALNVGAHTFKHGDQEWHCACLIRYQEAEIENLRVRVDMLKARVRTLTGDGSGSV